MFGARFDDATTGRSMVLEDPVDELVAMSLDDVPTAVAAASAASASGRWVAGYVTYEAAPAFDPTLAVQRPTVGPLAWFGVFDSMVEGPVADPEAPHGAYGLSPWTPRWEPDIHAKAVDRVIDRIRSGDTYQINLTFPLVAAFHGDPAALYADLVAAQRPAYATHIHHGDLHVVSSSPERFFSVDGRRIVTSPMKGTTRRGRWVEEDAAAHDRLVSSPKDRAENLMIVDLIRNDLGRIAVFGSVEVGGLFDVEPYPTVWQMTSTVTAELRDDVTLTDVFGALFPCGSVTGAPKPSSMRIIADTEPAPRGVYCGAVGFIPPGDGRHGASFNVAIRTVQLDLAEGFATYGTGGGVTWYSEPEDEYAEAVAKTLVLRRHRAVHGLIETIRWDPGPRGSSTGSWTLLDAHLDRLEASSAYFDLPFDRARTTDLLESTVAG
ncbi:MAG: aminodeoxychorismate synthase component I [Acidimicrobiia bacterium]|nr:aminodeoxychorismate synthase component I [Acidimicrobiia bacterium]